MKNIILIYITHIFICISLINKVILNPCSDKISSYCPYSESKLLEFYAKGIIPSNSSEDTYNITYVTCMNNYYTTGCVVKSLGDNYYKKSGVIIGSFIDISTLSNVEDIPLSLKYKLINYTKLLGEDAESYIQDYPLVLSESEIDTINSLVYKKRYEEMKNYFHLDKLVITTTAENSLLSFYIKYYKQEDVLKAVSRYIDSKSWNFLSYYFFTLYGEPYYYKKVLFLNTQTIVNTGHDRYHIGLFLDNSLDESNWENFTTFSDEFLKELNEKTILTLANSTKIISENKNINDTRNILIHNYTYKKSGYSIQNGLNLLADSMIKYYNKNNNPSHIFYNLYYKRIAFIILNDKPQDDELNFTLFNNNGINVILFGNINSSLSSLTYDYMKNNSNNENNIIPFKCTYLDLYKNKVDYFKLIQASIITQFETIKFSNNNDNNDNDNNDNDNNYCNLLENEQLIIKGKNELLINNINTYSDDSTFYFKIDKNENDLLLEEEDTVYYYNTEIKFNDNKLGKLRNITMFISNNNPYTDVANYDIINFNLDKEHFPLMCHRSSYNDSKYYYIGIFGSNLNISIHITREKVSKCGELNSNGLYGKSVDLIINETNDYCSYDIIKTLSCPIPKEDLFKQYVNGIGNIGNHQIGNISYYFNWDIFYCLYPKYKGPYYKLSEKKEIKYENGLYIGFEFPLQNKTFMNLYLEKNIPLYLINKLYPFLGLGTDTKLINNTLKNYNLYLERDELIFFDENTIEKMVQKISDLPNLNEYTTQFCFILKEMENAPYSDEDKLLLKRKDYYNFIKNNIMKDYDNVPLANKTQKEFQVLLLESLNQTSHNQILLSFIVGNSLIYDENFKSLFIDQLNGQRALSYYGKKSDNNNEFFIKKLFNFNNDTIQMRNAFPKYDPEFIETFNENDTFDIVKILGQQEKFFKLTDQGFKKVIVLMTSRIDKNNNTIEDYKFYFDKEKFNQKIKKLKENGIEVILLVSDYSYNKYGFKNNFNDINIIKFNNLKNICSFADLIIKKIVKMNLPVLKLKKKLLILDMDENEIMYYQFFKNNNNLIINSDNKQNNKKKKPLKYRFKIDNPNIDFYYSENHPFPNNFLNNNSLINSNIASKRLEINVFIGNNTSPHFYLALKAKKNIKYLTIDIEEIFQKSMTYYEIYKIIWISFFSVGILIFIYGIYNCFWDVKMQSEYNIFE